MRYRVTTLLFVTTLTAIALAGRPWLSRNDEIVFLLIFGLWTSLAFSFGWTAGRWGDGQFSLWIAAAGGIVGNWCCWYFLRLGLGFIRSPDTVFHQLPTGLSWLLAFSDWHLFLTLATIITAVLTAAAWLRNGRMLAAAIAVSLLAWSAMYWAAFLFTAAASAPPG